MPKTYTVSSLPLKDVIQDLAKQMDTTYTEKCTEFIVTIPDDVGSGEIRGINFDNGLGIIIYRCVFNKSTQIKFTVDKVHPLKYLYTANGFLSHQFANEDILHSLKPRMCALVASEQHNGHILHFEADRKIDIISLEIDREKFIKVTECHLVNLSPRLRELFQDVEAKETFYHDGFYNLEFNEIFESIERYEDELLVRKFHLESKALDIFVEQVRLYQDDTLGNTKEVLLRYNELERIKELSEIIEDNLDKEMTIEYLSTYSGLNPSKLQKGFKYIFNSTVREYIIQKRLEKAKRLLLSTDYSIAYISSMIGLDSPSYFSKVFKSEYRFTPSDFRKFYISQS